ncbi:phosphoribosylamine--glycine ligase [Patescibacteria group bacterium]|nr:phosphoribosylamine--glycine ligase [Patescibacteria group bacterium]
MEKKNFLFVSLGSALIRDIAWNVFKEGNEVRYFIGSESDKEVADGFVPKTDDWKRDLDWADIVIFDDSIGSGKEIIETKKRGIPVIGGTPYTDKLEENRSFGQEELKKAGVPILPHKYFFDFDEAIGFVKENPHEYVIKPSGDAQNIKRLLFVGMEKDGSDVVRVLEAYKKVWSQAIKEFQIQRKVNGVEIAVGAFFNGKNFIYPININFEHKKLFPGNIGPSTGEMGTSMFWSGPNKLFNETLKKMEKKLAKEKFIGYIDLNCIVNGKGIYPLEFTPRFGYPIITMQKDSVAMPFGEFLYDLASGKDFTIKTKKGFHIGVRILLPPYPYGEKSIFDYYSKGATVVFKKKDHLDGIHIEDVKNVRGEWVLAGTSGLALVVTGSGISMKQAQHQVYNRIENILIPNMFYRKDIGDRWYEDSDKLHSWGYLREM